MKRMIELNGKTAVSWKTVHDLILGGEPVGGNKRCETEADFRGLRTEWTQTDANSPWVPQKKTCSQKYFELSTKIIAYSL